MSAPPQQLLEMSLDCRKLFERLLKTSLGHNDVRDTCLYGSILVAASVNRFTPLTARVRGGDGLQDGGYLAPDGRLRGHYWVEATETASGAGWVLDLTADQFGAPTVLVLSLEDSRLTHLPGNQDVVDEHVRSQGFLA